MKQPVLPRRGHLRTTLLAALLILLAVPGIAAAHAILVESEPPVGGTVPAGPVAFRLRYNSRIDHDRSRLTLTRPDRTREVLRTPADDRVDMLTTAADLAPGSYSLRWQVLAVDGHITRGDVSFVVVPAAVAPVGSAAPPGQPAPARSPTPADGPTEAGR